MIEEISMEGGDVDGQLSATNARSTCFGDELRHSSAPGTMAMAMDGKDEAKKALSTRRFSFFVRERAEPITMGPKPRIYRSPLSVLFVYWIQPLLRFGWRNRRIEAENLVPLREDQKSQQVYPKFMDEWNQRKPGPHDKLPKGLFAGSKSLLGTLKALHGWQVLMTILLQFFYSGATLTSPILLREVITYIGEKSAGLSDADYKGYLFAMGLFLAPFFGALCYSQSNQIAFTVQTKVRAELTSAIYRKSQVLSSRARMATETGKIVNLMSADVNNTVNVLYPFFGTIFTAPVTIIVALVLLYYQIKWGTFIGLGVLLLSTPVSSKFTMIVTKFRRKMLGVTDQRVRQTSQLLSGIRVLKLYAWEQAQKCMVAATRNVELSWLRKMALARVGIQTALFVSPLLAAVLSFMIYGLVNPDSLTPARVFSALALFNIMRFPLVILPFSLIQIGTSLVSIRRLTEFLRLEELQETGVGRDLSKNTFVSGGEFVWYAMESRKSEDSKGQVTEPETKESKVNGADVKQGGQNGNASNGGILAPSLGTADVAFRLENVNLEVEKGQLCMVVGRVGSGKSSLAAALLGNMDQLGGIVNVSGSTAYVAQQAWIMNDTLRNNVLFGQEPDEEKWNRSIFASALTSDLEVLPAGAETEIGEKGINLSGGQKQRVAIARALYYDADVYIMDDPLSAVDVHVGKHIFDHCISGMLKNKTRILVTNQLQYLSRADYIIFMQEGRIAAQGEYRKFMSQSADFCNMVAEFNSSSSDEPGEVLEEEEEGTVPRSQSTVELRKSLEEKSGLARKKSVDLLSKQQSQDEKLNQAEVKRMTSKPVLGRLMTIEARSAGQVKGNVYMGYAKAYGLFLVVVVSSLVAAEQALRVLTNWWLSQWSDASFTGYDNGRTTGYYIGIYGALTGAFATTTLIRSLSNNLSAVRAARKLHFAMLDCIVRVPISFFDTTPVGRVLNRFSKDTDEIDYLLPQSMTEFINCLMQPLGAMIFISVVEVWFLAGIVPLMIIYYFIQKFFRATSIELQRLDAVSKSPVFSHFSECLSGVETIRAFRLQDRFAKSSDLKQDANNQAYWTLKHADEWLSVRLELIGASITFLAAVLGVANADNLNSALIGLAITEALEMTAFLKHAVRTLAMVEVRLNAVDRVLEYSRLPVEAPDIVPDCRPPEDWPSKGRVTAENVHMKYRPDTPMVLKGVSFDIRPGEHIGIVGRTGSGKSSLLVALFRIVELHGGSIKIDDVDVSRIGLEDLRSRIAAIPQDPALFSGTVRSNLDPYSRHTDPEIWEALEHAYLKDTVKSMRKGLESGVSEGGENFSVGQRQLMCVARALLRKPKVLIADEATASVDPETDALLQKTIRTRFKNSTVITIAHRLNTILDSDKVMVMENGHLAEFDSVSRLLGNPNSLFKKLIDTMEGEQAPASDRE